MTFPARYSGLCPACDSDICRGDPVRYSDGLVVHDDCGAPEPEHTVVICARCYMAKATNGKCGCDE